MLYSKNSPSWVFTSKEPPWPLDNSLLTHRQLLLRHGVKDIVEQVEQHPAHFLGHRLYLSYALIKMGLQLRVETLSLAHSSSVQVLID